MTEIKIEYLRTANEQAEGLQHRASLDQNTVLFFENIPSGTTFHSQNCKFAFSIAFVDREGTILKINDYVSPPEELINSPRNTHHAVEANAGWFEQNNYKVGDKFLL